jgi:hypothetical protein
VIRWIEGAIGLCWLGLASTATAQVRVAIPRGVLRGATIDSVRQAGLSYALVTVIGADRRAFADVGGGFVITGLKPGPDRVRVQQIGFAPVEIDVSLVDPGRDPTASAQLTIALGTRVQILPELTVTAARDLRTYRQPRLVVDQAITNADRILAVELDYPFIVTFEHIREAYDSTERLVGRWIDTIPLNPAKRMKYRRGRVIGRDRLGRPSDAVYFTMGDLGQDEFQAAHCLWYVGVDSTDAGRVHRIAFEPAPGVRTADWAGNLQFDRDSYHLVRSDAWLVSVRAESDLVRSARCAVRYGGEIPTIIHEQLALCLTDTDGSGTASSRDIYRVIATRFLGRRPGEQP